MAFVDFILVVFIVIPVILIVTVAVCLLIIAFPILEKLVYSIMAVASVVLIYEVIITVIKKSRQRAVHAANDQASNQALPDAPRRTPSVDKPDINPLASNNR